MVAQEASARQEILERVRHKHQRREILIQNISNKLAVNRDFVTSILQQLVTEGVVRTDNVDGVEIVTLVLKK
jgi:DNA-binding IscR family transcriptional regulator